MYGTSPAAQRKFLEERLPEPYSVTFTAGDIGAGFKDITHGIGRVPVAYRVVYMRAAADVDIRHEVADEASWSGTIIRLRATGECIVKFEFY